MCERVADLYDVDGRVLVVRPDPLLDDDPLVEVASEDAQEPFQGPRGRRPVPLSHGPATEPLQHDAQRPVSDVLDDVCETSASASTNTALDSRPRYFAPPSCKYYGNTIDKASLDECGVLQFLLLLPKANVPMIIFCVPPFIAHYVQSTRLALTLKNNPTPRISPPKVEDSSGLLYVSLVHGVRYTL